jgi:hypothetical protein
MKQTVACARAANRGDFVDAVDGYEQALPTLANSHQEVAPDPPDSSHDLCHHTGSIVETQRGSLKPVHECADKADVCSVSAGTMSRSADA